MFFFSLACFIWNPSRLVAAASLFSPLQPLQHQRSVQRTLRIPSPRQLYLWTEQQATQRLLFAPGWAVHWKQNKVQRSRLSPSGWLLVMVKWDPNPYSSHPHGSCCWDCRRAPRRQPSDLQVWRLLVLYILLATVGLEHSSLGKAGLMLQPSRNNLQIRLRIQGTVLSLVSLLSPVQNTCFPADSAHAGERNCLSSYLELPARSNQNDTKPLSLSHKMQNPFPCSRFLVLRACKPEDSCIFKYFCFQ